MKRGQENLAVSGKTKDPGDLPSATYSSSASGAALALLFVVAIFSYMDRYLIAVLQVPIKAELGFTDAQLGAVTGLAFAAVYATAAVPLARVVDRGRRLLIMATALVAWSTLTALTGLVVSFAGLVACRFGLALGEAVCVPATHSLLADYFPLKLRGRVFAIWALAAPIGMMAGLAGGGWLAQGVGWRLSFAIVGMSGLILAPVLLLLKEPVRGRFEPVSATGSQAGRAPPFWQSFKALMRIRSFPVLICAVTLHLFGTTSLLNWSGPFYARVHQMPLSEMATTVALVVGIGGGLGTLLSGYLVDLLGRRDARWYAWAPGAAMLLSAPLGVAQVLVPNATASIALGVAAAALGAVYLAPTCAAVQSMVPPQMRAFAASILLLIPAVLGSGVGPYLTGALSDYLASSYSLGGDAIRYAICVALAGSALGGAVYLSADRRLARDLSRMASAAQSPAPI